MNDEFLRACAHAAPYSRRWAPRKRSPSLPCGLVRRLARLGFQDLSKNLLRDRACHLDAIRGGPWAVRVMIGDVPEGIDADGKICSRKSGPEPNKHLVVN